MALREGEAEPSFCSTGCWKRTGLSVCTQKGPCVRGAAERKCLRMVCDCCCPSLGLSGEVVPRSRLWAGEWGCQVGSVAGCLCSS